MGPLVSEAQMKRVLEYVEIGKKEGAKLVTGGDQPKGEKYGSGYYVNPTIFSDVKSDMRVVQEEIFGPVVVVQKFSSEEEAVELANDSLFGLAGAVFTNDITRAHRVVKAIASWNYLGQCLPQYLYRVPMGWLQTKWMGPRARDFWS
jgi:betaine-aldehyde dehydrogenase